MLTVIEVLSELSQARRQLVYLLAAVGGLSNLGAQLLLHLSQLLPQPAGTAGDL